MKSILSLILIQLLLLGQSELKLKPKPLKANGVELKELATIMDEDEGFYNRVLASFSPDGKLIVADVGNTSINIYDKNYKLIRSFGKEGNGPGEIDKIFRLNTAKDRVYVRSFNRLMVFDFKGKHFNDIRLFENGSPEVIFLENEILFRYKEGKFKQISYDRNGKLKEKYKDSDYVEEKDQSRGGMVMRFLSGAESIQAYQDGFVKGTKGEFKLQIMDENFSVLKVLTRPFERIKRDFTNFKMSFKMDGVSKKEQAEMKKKAMQQMRKQLGEYKDDIRSILGTVKGYLLISTASEDDDEIHIDVISPDLSYYAHTTYKKDEFLNARVENEKLLLCLKNEDDGPYVKVFDVAIH